MKDYAVSQGEWVKVTPWTLAEVEAAIMMHLTTKPFATTSGLMFALRLEYYTKQESMLVQAVTDLLRNKVLTYDDCGYRLDWETHAESSFEGL